MNNFLRVLGQVQKIPRNKDKSQAFMCVPDAFTPLYNRTPKQLCAIMTPKVLFIIIASLLILMRI